MKNMKVLDTSSYKSIYMFLWISIFICACQSVEKKSENQAKSDSNIIQAKITSVAKNSDTLQPSKENSRNEYILQIDSSTIKLPILMYPNSKENLEPILEAFQEGDTVKIVCYGNSITNGYKVGTSGRVANPYPESLEKKLQTHYKNQHIKIINQGHNGWRSGEALANVQRLVIAEKPTLVILEFGINDVYSSLSPARFEQNMRQLISQIKASNIRILVLLPTPIQTEYESKVQQYAPVLEKITKEEKIAFFDLHSAILQRLQEEKITLTKLLPDNVHLADDYYVWISDAIFDFLIEKK